MSQNQYPRRVMNIKFCMRIILKLKPILNLNLRNCAKETQLGAHSAASESVRALLTVQYPSTHLKHSFGTPSSYNAILALWYSVYWENVSFL